MDRNSLLAAMLSLAAVFLLSNPVESCVNFKAAELGNNNGLYQIQLWDNGQKVCSCDCYPAYGQIYQLSCNSGLSAIFDLSDTHVTYYTGHGTFGFDTYGDGFSEYKACLYGCGPNDCNLSARGHRELATELVTT